MKRRLVIHIGMPRAGSSSLQGTLFRNQEKLLKGGLLYPVNSLETAQASEISAIYNHKLLHRSSGGLLPNSMFRAYHDEIAEVIEASSAEAVVLSYEGWWHPHGPARLARTLKRLSKTVSWDEVSVFAIVRNPVSFLRSLYTLQVVSANTDSDFETFLPIGLKDPRLRYHAILSGMTRRMKHQVPIVVEEFEAMTENGNLVETAFAKMGLEAQYDAANIKDIASLKSAGTPIADDPLVAMFLFAARDIGPSATKAHAGKIVEIVRDIATREEITDELGSLVIPINERHRSQIEAGAADQVGCVFRDYFGKNFRDTSPRGDNSVQTFVSPNSRIAKLVRDELKQSGIAS